MRDKDPSCFNKRIKYLIKECTSLFGTFWKNRRNFEMITCLKNLHSRLAILMKTANKIITLKLWRNCKILREAPNHISVYSKSFRILKNAYHWHKTLCTTWHKNEFITEFKKRIFNSFFADQYSLISNGSELPSKPEWLTQSRLSLNNFFTDNMIQLIQNLDPNKAHGHDQISIRMIKAFST